jgi:hypothetical protein
VSMVDKKNLFFANLRTSKSHEKEHVNRDLTDRAPNSKCSASCEREV